MASNNKPIQLSDQVSLFIAHHHVLHDLLYSLVKLIRHLIGRCNQFIIECIKIIIIIIISEQSCQKLFINLYYYCIAFG